MRHYIIPLLEKDSGLYFVQGMRKGKIPFTNAFLAKDVLFDTGISPIRLKYLKKKFPIKKVIFSHWHDDHIRDNKLLNDIPHLCHATARIYIEDMHKFMLTYDLIGSQAEGMFRNYINNVIKINDTRIDVTFEGGDIIKISNGIEFKVLLAPGHSSGHCIFYNKKNKMAYLADIDLSEFGPWYGAKDCDLLEFENSIELVKNLNLDTAVTGHSGIFQGSSSIRNKLEQYKIKIDDRDEIILSHFSERKPLKLKDLWRKKLIYHSYAGFGDFLPIMERTMIEKHFEKLLEQGIIQLENNGYILS